MHHNASEGYARSADAYTTGRPSYPESLVPLILDGLDPETAVVLDVGAGPGTLSARLAGNGPKIVAVEPVHAMAAKVPSPIPAVRATAEQLPFRAATADTIVVGTAFHWFAGRTALAELHRVLKAGARLRLVWNAPDRNSAFVRAHDDLVAPYIGDTPRYADMNWRRELEKGADLFRPADEQRIANPTAMTRDQFVARVLSTSFVAALDQTEKDTVRQRAAELARTVPEVFEYPYSCHLVRLESI